MMFDLEIQSTYQPGNNRVVGGKIGRGLDLVDSPFVIQLARFRIGHGESRMFHSMSQLEYHAQYEARDTGEDDKTDQPAFETYLIDRKTDKEKGVENLETPENEMICQTHFLQGHSANLAFEILLIVQQKDPENVKDAVEKPEIKMLVPVKAVFFLRFAHPHPGLDIDVVVDAVYICISMVDNIMLHIPHEAISSQDIQRESSQSVQPFIFRKASMCPVMHHIESNRGYEATQQHTLYDRPKGIGCKKHQVNVDERKAKHQYDSLDKKIVITCLRFSHFLKIGANSLLQFSVE
jgi:hypothetical protein